MEQTKGYTLFKKTLADGKSWLYYVQFTDKAGKRMTAKSVQKLRSELGDSETYKITRRTEADSICRRAIEAGFAEGRRERMNSNRLFSEYLTSFWDFDTSEYIKRRNTKSQLEGKSQAIHRNYASNRAGDVRNHIIPRLPKKLQCKDVSFNLIDCLQQDIINEKGVGIWLNVRRTLSPAIKELIRTRVLVSDPLLGIETYSASSHSNVGSFTQAEANALLRQMYRDCTVGRDVETRKLFPGSRNKETEYKNVRFMLDRRVWLASCILFQCGLRLGEVIAMTIDQISLPNPDEGESMGILVVDKAYGLKDGIKEPKGKQNRAVAIPLWLATELMAMYEQNPWKDMGNKFIFFSTEVSNKPCAESFIRKWFYHECDQIDITEEVRKQRHLVIHSCRHTTTQRVITKAGSEAALTVIGHSGQAVQSRYDNAVDLERVMNIGRKTGSIIPSLDDMASAI